MNNDQFVKLCLPIFLGLVVRSGILLYPHSGQSKPPLYGDYEAQRHWMEITTNLPIHSWYANSTENDLNYWGLDYPPLTAFHSWLMGKLSAWFNPQWTVLLTSHGVESYEHKVFMRYTVLLADLLVFVPSVLLFFHRAIPRIVSNPNVSSFYACCLVLLYPGLLLIDHGHFQYNCISLGLFLAAVDAFLLDCDILGTIFFCLALGYKQMEFYHALPLFFYILGKCLRGSFHSGFVTFLQLSFTVLFTSCLIFLPFFASKETFFQVLHRIFPVARGLYEDKVANFWCSTSPLIKWRLMFSHVELIRLCSLFVFLLSLPCCLSLIIAPRKIKLLYALVVCSMNFFLFSYQVHEKSILLVAVPALCLLPICPISSFLFALTSSLSMWPLLLKDGLALPCVCTVVLYTLIGHAVVMRNSSESARSFGWLTPNTLLIGLLTGFGLLFFAQAVVPSPSSYPDLFPLVISIYSCGQFFAYLIFWNWQAFTDLMN
ncbi:Alpha-1 3-glucosyltransferase [Paragonimus heterotremus]|uniref:Alpha-1,3-glucosyltransferase n=1 Tax=Paragonimus heterotremus TaxID=100268 RepID=A0A8J4T9E3_9TREM|nr:Alpha-1 3-glucosyltransferase [Paragonimus heterotremus]